MSVFQWFLVCGQDWVHSTITSAQMAGICFMCVCVHVTMYKCVYTYLCTCVSIVCMFQWSVVCGQDWVSSTITTVQMAGIFLMCVCVCVCVCMCVCVCECVYTYVCIYVQIYECLCSSGP